MSISRKLMTAGGEEASTYVEDVFSTHLYKGYNDRGYRIENGIALADRKGSTTFDSLAVGSAQTNTEITGVASWTQFFLPNDRSWSIEFWVRHTAPLSSLMYLFDGRDSLAASDMYIYWGSTLRMIHLGQEWGRPGSAPNYDTSGGWNHVAWSMVDNSLSVFVNGVRDGSVMNSTGYSFGIHAFPTIFQACQGTPYPMKNVELQDWRWNIGTTPYDPLSDTIDVPTERLKSTGTTTILLFNGGDTVDELLTNRAAGTNNVATAVGNAISGSSSSPYASSPKEIEGKGGLVWIKNRTTTYDHWLFDTERGALNGMRANTTEAETSLSDSLTEFNADGFSIGGINEVDYQHAASWTFAKQEGFFDIVTYTGDGVLGRDIPHALGTAPGMMMIKSLASGQWYVWHKDIDSDPQYDGQRVLYLNGTNARSSPDNGYFNSTVPTDSVFTTGTDHTNVTGVDFVAYLFAHDAPLFGPDGDESIIKCGSYAGTASANGPEIDLGWEPQFLLIKKSSGTEDWIMLDTMRGLPAGGNFSRLNPNLNDEEQTNLPGLEVTPTGFKLTGPFAQVNDNADYIYMAIRRPHKPAKEFEPTELFAMAAPRLEPEPYYNSGFPVDMAWDRNLPTSDNTRLSARQLQGRYAYINTTAAAGTLASQMFDYNDGWISEPTTLTRQSWMWRRAPGFFDVVTYEGDNVTGSEVPHSLGVVPEMMWVRNMDSSQNWYVYSDSLGPSNKLHLDSAIASTSSPDWNDTSPTDTVFTLGGGYNINGTTHTHMACLWASVPGICDIGSYTGTGANDRDIDCGFANGARFVLIKRTDLSEDWVYFDTLRGIGSTSPTLKLNVTDSNSLGFSYLKPYAGGFRINGAGLVNGLGGEYIYMAIA